MEGASSFARLDSRRRLSPHEHLRNSVTLSVFLLQWAQVIVERKFEIHQLGAFGIGNAGDVDVGAGEGRGDVFHIEEEESGLRVVRLDGFRGESRGFDFVAFFFAEGAFHLFLRDGKWQGRVGVGAGIGDAAVDVFGRSGGEFGVVGGDEFHVDVGDGDGLVAVVGHDEEDGQESVFVKVHGEYLRFVRRIVGVGGEGDFLVGMVVVRGIGIGGVSCGSYKIFGGEGGDCAQDKRGAGEHTVRLHSLDYRTGFENVFWHEGGPSEAKARCKYPTSNAGLEGLLHPITSPACSVLLHRLLLALFASSSRFGFHPKTSGAGDCLEWLDLISSLYSFLYSVALAVGMLASLPYWLFQMARHGKYRKGLAERLGRVPSRLQLPGREEPAIWVHSVSVGEVLAVAGLVEELRHRFPRDRIFISTTTDTGQALARQRFGEANVFYFAMDFAFAIRPYMRALRPRLVVIAETEFWPNFLRLAHASGARIAVVNARISDRSWPRYRRFRGLLRRLLANVDLFLAQTQEDAARLRDIGAGPERVRVSGNLKFDIPAPAPPAIVESLRKSIAASAAGPVLVCGSTVDGEEPLLLKAFENLLVQHPRALMILAPRRPERFGAVAALLERMSIRFWRRSAWNGEALSAGVFLLDTIGELAALYALADVAFVGGSLVAHGGHNIIEPAQHGVATVVGNHTENFRDIVSLFRSRDAVRIVGPAELPLVLLELLANDAERIALGRRAAETMRSQIGATARTADELQALLARP